ncbi:conserved hypothetical protein [gamma proteobacterium HTCC5015]|nr:conserved hypothetical protein [gamma proteobacterium HTCC5015]
MKLQSLNKQSGAALVVSMVLLAVMTLLAVTAMRSTGIDEKMVGNMQQVTELREAVQGELRAHVWELAVDSSVGNTDITAAENANNQVGKPLSLGVKSAKYVNQATMTSYGTSGGVKDDDGRRLYAAPSWCNSSLGSFSCYAMLIQAGGELGSTGLSNNQEAGFGAVGPGVEGDVNVNQGS